MVLHTVMVFRRRWCFRLFFLFVAVSGLMGCGNEGEPLEQSELESQSAGLDADALFAEWKRVIANPEENEKSPQHQILAMTIVAQDPAKGSEMVDLLTDPETKPESMLLVLSSLEVALTPDVVKRLLELTRTEVDPAVRSGVTMLLAQSADEAVVERFRELKDDADRRVRFAALNALLLHGDPDARASLREMYFEEETPAVFRERIAMTFGMSPEVEDVTLLSDAALRDDLSEDARAIVVSALAASGDPAALAALHHCAEGDYADDIKAIARDGAAAIEAKATAQESVDSPEAGTETPGESPAIATQVP